MSSASETLPLSPSILRPKFAIASLSLGNNLYHDLPTKIRVASELGYDGIEMFMPDFETFVDEVRQGKHREVITPPMTALSTSELELACAQALSDLCTSSGLEIPVLQPFRNFENFRSQEQVDAALDEAERWFRLMPAFRCDLMLVCSNYIPPPYPITDDFTMEMYLDAQVDAFRQLGSLAEKYDVKVGYEPLAWGTVVDNWMQVWEVVRRTDRPNVGIILDSFNSLANQYGDPGEFSCIRPKQTLHAMLENLKEMARQIPGEKIFIYQLADGVRPPQILQDGGEMPRRMKWSRTCRVFPCEPPSSISQSSADSYDPLSDLDNPPSNYLGFLPVTQMTSLIHRTGFRGYWSLEVYNTSLFETDKGCPWRHGRRGIDGLKVLWDVVRQDPLAEAEHKRRFPAELGLEDDGTSSPPQLSSGTVSESTSENPSEVDEKEFVGVPLEQVDDSKFDTEEARIEIVDPVAVAA